MIQRKIILFSLLFSSLSASDCVDSEQILSDRDTITYEPTEIDITTIDFVRTDSGITSFVSDSPLSSGYIYSDPALPWPHKFTIAPEVYYVKRERAGGTTQTGWATGGRFSYEYIKRCSLYWGINGLYAAGDLQGNTSSDRILKSNYIDKQIEGRIGYNFQSNRLSQVSFIPYFAIGYSSETNNYVDPSPVIVNFEIQYPYCAFGFVSSFMIRPFFRVGLNFEGKAMYDTKCKVTNDPEYADLTMYASDRFNYRVEAPIVYRIPYLYDTFEIGVVPFYELRRYGGRENYPFDFLETRVNIYGFNIQFNVRI